MLLNVLARLYIHSKRSQETQQTFVTNIFNIERILSFNCVCDWLLIMSAALMITQTALRSVSKMVLVLLASSTDSNSCLIFAIGSLSTQASDYYLDRLLQQMSDNISIISICLPMIVKFMGKQEENNNIQDPRASSMGHLRRVQSLSTLSSNLQNQDVELSSVEIMRG
ncbi:hypothetical protein M9X92_011649 [Pyricularia oryzae]|nr:hypothetical protein M9X92_011649 [Pyricularia oryzae]